MMGWEDGGWHGWGYGLPFMLLFWVLLAVGIVLIVRWLVGARDSGGSRALEILEERYARGEIEKDEFEQRKRDLTQR